VERRDMEQCPDRASLAGGIHPIRHCTRQRSASGGGSSERRVESVGSDAVEVAEGNEGCGEHGPVAEPKCLRMAEATAVQTVHE
jgi:hypothetical protein